MSLLAAGVVLGVCLLLEGFFSGSELALIAADKVHLRHIAEQKGQRGRLIVRFLEDPGPLISTALTGTNACVVLSSVVTTLTAYHHYPRRAELVSLLVVTPLVLVVGEIVPKSLFQHYADRLAAPLIYVLSAFRLLFYPLVALGSALSRALLRLLRLQETAGGMTREELRLLITLPSRAGADRITMEERRMVSRIFDFAGRTVEDVMLPLSETRALSVTASIDEIVQVIHETGYTRIPLYRERLDQIEGILHAFDLVRAAPDRDVASLLRPAIFVPEGQPAVDTLVRLQREGQGMAIVVDEYGGAVGVVTLEDILEQVVGEIEDEYDAREVDLIRHLAPGRFMVKGRASVDQVNAALKVQLPRDEDYETVAGLMLDQLKRIPTAGERLRVGPIVLTAIKTTDRSVDEIEVQIRSWGTSR